MRFYASYIFAFGDYTPNEPDPAGGYRGLTLPATTHAEAARVAKDTMATRIGKMGSNFAPGLPEKIIIFSDVEGPDRVQVFAYNDI